MIDNIINKNPTGNDVIKGGVFFGSNLTPSGSFSNIPQYITTEQINNTNPSLMLTLQKVKDSLNSSIQQQTGANTTSDKILEKYLYDFVNLLIDYRDIRNYVFYGSANTEIAYNINYIINNYPYSTLVGQPYGNNFIQLNSYVENLKAKTEIVFPETYYYNPNEFVRIILDNYNKFNFNNDNTNFNWSNYQIVDKNGKRYNIENVITPYKSPSIFNISNIININVNIGGINYSTIEFHTYAAHNYEIGQSISFENLLCVNPNIELNYYIPIFNGVNYDNYYYKLNGSEFVIDTMTSNSFTVRRPNGDAYENIQVDTISLSPFYDYSKPGFVKLYPDTANTHPFVIKMIIDGGFSQENFMDFVYNGNSTKGFLIAPLISIVNDWSINLSPVQNMLLAPSPINPTPWPRRPITNNIMNMLDDSLDIDNPDIDFVSWLKNPSTLYTEKLTDDVDVDAAWTSYGLLYETNMIRALALDETETNQLIRRCIPADIISEIYDTSDFYFQRFILIAGWLFDNTKLYSKFIKYSHEVNTTPYNQLSPEYYRYLADYWGLTLFDDDQIDFSKLVIQTVPGQYFGISEAQIQTNRYYQQTLQQVQYARQKNLLMSLLFLYKQKGTQEAIQKLISLLGAPDGFLDFEEYVFKVSNTDNIGYPINNDYTGKRIIDNEKVHVPNVTFEIDPDYLLDKNNIENPINKPYIYRRILDNEYTHNLREISVLTNPNGAIDNQIVNSFGAQLYNYITFGKGEFANLQRNGKFFLLPLSLPDKFFGMSIEYMIPKNGNMKGIGKNTEEAVCDIFSLYKIKPADLKPIFIISNISINYDFSIITITTSTQNNYLLNDKVFVTDTNGINNLNNKMFVIESITDQYTFSIFGDFSGIWMGNGQVISGELDEFNNGGLYPLQYTYPLAIHYNERNRNIDTTFAMDSHSNNVMGGYTNPDTDFNILNKRYPDTEYIDEQSYIITRLEGSDLVIRLKIESEISGVYGERCALMPNIFSADGLNHSLRIVLREDGAEIYKDYYYVGIAKWINISNAGSYYAYEIPKSEIKLLLNETDNCTNYYEPIDMSLFAAQPDIYHTGADAINWWDLFIGMPDNIQMFFKKINFFDSASVNDFVIGDKLVDNNSDTSEFYLFEVANPTLNSRTFEEIQDFNVPAVFYELFPNSLPVYYGYALPQTQDQYSRDIIQDLALTNKRCYNEIKNGLMLNHTQDFFKFEKVFENNAWMDNIHKTHFYNLFNGQINNLYTLYGAQVLNYASLEEFMDLVEQKFRSTFKSFIPIVINIYEFGRLITNSEFIQSKMRIPGSNKVCEMSYLPTNSFMSTKIFKKSFYDMNGINNSDFSFYFETLDGTIITAFTTVNYTTDQFITLNLLKSAINSLSIAVGGHMQADVYSDSLRVNINYDWFFITYGISSNDVFFVIQQGTNIIKYKFAYGAPSNVNIHPAVYDSCGYLIKESYTDEEVCGSLAYVVPNLKPKQPYIYYETENKPPMYIRYSTEIGHEPVFVHFSNE